MYDPYGFIYITTNMINGKRYIGQKSFDVGGKWKSYLGSGKLLKRAISKYGSSNFKRDIIDVAYSQEELSLKEHEWINIYNAVESDDFYNLTDQTINYHGTSKSRGKRVVCIEDNKIFDSISEAAIYYKSLYNTNSCWIKKSFKINRLDILDVKKPIFRKYKKGIDKGKKLCSNCGRLKSTRGKYCVMCSKKIHDIKRRSKKTIFDIEQDVLDYYKKDIIKIYETGQTLQQTSDKIFKEYKIKMSISKLSKFLKNNNVKIRK